MAEENYFTKLNGIAGETDKLRIAGKDLTYISWPIAWEMLKKEHPTANFEVFQAASGMPYFKDEAGAFVKVGVSVMSVTHVVFLPILDNTNRTSKTPDAFLINKAIQRALTKAMAMHGIGLYAYKGEDFPEGHEQFAKGGSELAQRIAEKALAKPKSEEPEKKKYTDGKAHCFDCEAAISDRVAEFSNDKFGENLCMPCQKTRTKAAAESVPEGAQL